MYKKYYLILGLLGVLQLHCMFKGAEEVLNKSKKNNQTTGRLNPRYKDGYDFFLGACNAFKETFILEESAQENTEEFVNGTSKAFELACEKDGTFYSAIQKYINLLEDSSNKITSKIIYPNILTCSGMFLGVTAGSFAIPVIAKYIERELLNPTPKIIIESSKKNYTQYIRSLFQKISLPLEMVFSSSLKKQLDDVTKVTKTINEKIKNGKTNVKYRNLMLYGPSGTGKTIFAKQLAKNSGLDWVYMSGSSFSKFKDGDGITALDELFAWAKNSKGLMIFIDEAENFLSKRDNMDPQSKAYQLLNNFLNYTGERSSQFMLVFATNHKDVLDCAMYRRIDDLIEMPLPSKEQRIHTLILYKNKVLLDAKQNESIFIESVKKELNSQTIELIAEKTKGLSYGDLEGIINTIKTDTDILEPAIVTQKLIYTVVDRAVKKHDTFTNGKLLGTVED